MTSNTLWIYLFATSRAIYFALRGISLATALSIFSCDAGYGRQRNRHLQSGHLDMNADGTVTAPTACRKIAQRIESSYELIKT